MQASQWGRFVVVFVFYGLGTLMLLGMVQDRNNGQGLSMALLALLVLFVCGGGALVYYLFPRNSKF